MNLTVGLEDLKGLPHPRWFLDGERRGLHQGICTVLQADSHPQHHSVPSGLIFQLPPSLGFPCRWWRCEASPAHSHLPVPWPGKAAGPGAPRTSSSTKHPPAPPVPPCPRARARKQPLPVPGQLGAGWEQHEPCWEQSSACVGVTGRELLLQAERLGGCFFLFVLLVGLLFPLLTKNVETVPRKRTRTDEFISK